MEGTDGVCMRFNPFHSAAATRDPTGANGKPVGKSWVKAKVTEERQPGLWVHEVGRQLGASQESSWKRVLGIH